MKILRIEDTRDKMEVDDGRGDTRLVGIPGTGIESICDSCGRSHEIHVHVEDEKGQRCIVGLGCAKKRGLGMEIIRFEAESLAQENGWIIDFEQVDDKPYLWDAIRVAQTGKRVYCDRLSKAQKFARNKIENRLRKIKEASR